MDCIGGKEHETEEADGTGEVKADGRGGLGAGVPVRRAWQTFRAASRRRVVHEPVKSLPDCHPHGALQCANTSLDPVPLHGRLPGARHRLRAQGPIAGLGTLAPRWRASRPATWSPDRNPRRVAISGPQDAHLAAGLLTGTLNAPRRRFARPTFRVAQSQKEMRRAARAVSDQSSTRSVSHGVRSRWRTRSADQTSLGRRGAGSTILTSRSLLCRLATCGARTGRLAAWGMPGHSRALGMCAAVDRSRPAVACHVNEARTSAHAGLIQPESMGHVAQLESMDSQMQAGHQRSEDLEARTNGEDGKDIMWPLRILGERLLAGEPGGAAGDEQQSPTADDTRTVMDSLVSIGTNLACPAYVAGGLLVAVVEQVFPS
mmetsp:Transcript_60808/g.195914  ORF Transcript_60808/g.195914 Transcript_60808/m.195914 type:complete len:374 (-) Transcript_60808:227-1348(-)